MKTNTKDLRPQFARTMGTIADQWENRLHRGQSKNARRPPRIMSPRQPFVRINTRCRPPPRPTTTRGLPPREHKLDVFFCTQSRPLQCPLSQETKLRRYSPPSQTLALRTSTPSQKFKTKFSRACAKPENGPGKPRHTARGQFAA